MIQRKNKELARTLTPESVGQGSVKVQGPNIDAFVARMKVLVQRFGSLAEVARKGGFAESTVKKWADGISDPSRARCIQLADGTGASLMWLVAGQEPVWAADVTVQATAHGDTGESHLLRPEVLTMAVELIDSELERAGKELPVDKRAQAYGLVYELLIEPGELPSAKILQLVVKAVA